MKIKSLSLFFTLILLPALPLQAKTSPEDIAKLGGPDYTCMGAERAGTASGVAEFSGQWFKTWPGVNSEHGWEPGPYKDEAPLYEITAANMGEYAELMTPGQQALMKKYSDQFKMKVYPSHRDFRFADWVCDVVKHNAEHSEIIDDGLGVTGTAGAHPFPFPKTGLEAIYNAILPHRAFSEKTVFDIADVYATGSVAWGRARFMTMAPGITPDRSQSPQYTDHINAYFYMGFLLPDREKGFVAVGYQPNNFKSDSTQSWQYLPGIRRVRKAPEVGFDYPVPPSGLRTVDDDYLYNGSPERYNWTLVGKKEFLVPYHNFKLNSPELSYKEDIIRAGTINSDYVRYELHRVWVIEGNLKDGVRHIYKKRRLYVDEDTWLTFWADNYDGQGQLWRANFAAFFYSQESGTYHRGASIYHDLTSGNYEATYLTNESDHWWRLNTPLKPAMFSPEAAARSGH
ncbi:MAG: DUF1329 domain-containing protein [Oceanococcus sp.]